MTVEDLKELIQDLPDDMLVIIPMGEGVYLAACNGQSGVREVEFPDSPLERMLVLYPCTCNSDEINESDLGEINLN